MHFSPTTCAHTHAGCIANPWLPPLIHPPPTHSHSKKDVFSLLSFHVYISNTPWYSKLVKNHNSRPCSTCWGKHDGSGSAGTNIPGVPSVSHSVYISFFFFPPRQSCCYFCREDWILSGPWLPLLPAAPVLCSVAHQSPLGLGASATLSPQRQARMWLLCKEKVTPPSTCLAPQTPPAVGGVRRETAVSALQAFGCLADANRRGSTLEAEHPCPSCASPCSDPAYLVRSLMNTAWSPKTEYLLYLSSLSQRNQSCALIILAGSALSRFPVRDCSVMSRALQALNRHCLPKIIQVLNFSSLLVF